MSSNVSAPNQAQLVSSTSGSAPPRPSVHLPVLPNNVGLQGGSKDAPAILGVVPIPIDKLSKMTDKQIQKYVMEVVIHHGIDSAARIAAQLHNSKDDADPLTHEELRQRISDAEADLGEKYDLFQQEKPGAIASRLLAPRAGQRYGYEDFKSTWTDAKGKKTTGHKCKGPGCQYRNKDQTRHQNDSHVKDPVFALYCPYGCGRVYYYGRDSQMTSHIKRHQEKQDPLPTYESA